MLSEAYLRDANPKLQEALEHNTAYLADRMLSQEARYAGELERARILFRLGRVEQCARTLDQIPPGAPVEGEVILTRGRIQLAEARAIKNDPELMESGENLKQALPSYQRAIELFRQAQAHDALASNTTRKAMYLVGVCYMETGNLAPAYEQLERTRKL
jgi:tetratricopeptide (TPR) repeat protein